MWFCSLFVYLHSLALAADLIYLFLAPRVFVVYLFFNFTSSVESNNDDDV